MKALCRAEEVAQTIRRFVTAPPDGTPPEVIDALSGPKNDAALPLPPRLFLEAVEQLTVSISITDTNATILYANPAAMRLSGYNVGEMVGQNQSMLSDKTTPAEVYQQLWETITSGRPWAGILVNRRKDGSRYLADLTVVPVTDQDGRITHYLGMHRDVTEVNSLQKQVLNQKALVEAVVDAAPVAMALVDAAGRVVLDNLNYKSLMADLNREPVEFVFQAWRDAEGIDLIEAARNEVEFLNLDVAMCAPGKATRWFSCAGSWAHELELGAESYFDEADKQRGLLVVLNEVTEQRRQLEADRTNAVRALMAEQSMVRQMREVLEGAIFQLQGPLNLVSAAADMVERQEGVNGPLAPVLRHVLTTGQETLDRLKVAVPAEPTEPLQPVNVNEAVRDVLGILTETFLNRSVTVDWKPTSVMPAAIARPTALRALVKALLDNAIEALDEPGASSRDIVIETGVTDDDRVALTVRDTGPGLDEKLRLRVFEPFVTAWTRRSGHTGMGLALAQQTVTDHGGSIELLNRDAGGVKVRVMMPCAVKRQREPADE